MSKIVVERVQARRDLHQKVKELFPYEKVAEPIYKYICDFIDEYDDAPTIDAEPIRHAHWEVIDEAEPMRYGCSACHRLVWHTENYCPNCGAKMDEVTE